MSGQIVILMLLKVILIEIIILINLCLRRQYHKQPYIFIMFYKRTQRFYLFAITNNVEATNLMQKLKAKLKLQTHYCKLIQKIFEYNNRDLPYHFFLWQYQIIRLVKEKYNPLSWFQEEWCTIQKNQVTESFILKLMSLFQVKRAQLKIM